MVSKYSKTKPNTSILLGNNGSDYPGSRYQNIDFMDNAIQEFISLNPNTSYINEYYNPSSKSSGPHFHFSIT